MRRHGAERDRFLIAKAAALAFPLLSSLGSPAGPAIAEEYAPKDPVLVELPFEHSKEINRIVVDLAPDASRPFPLMLDTGASFSTLSPHMARDLGVSVRRIKSSPYRRETRLGRDLQFQIDVESSDTGERMGWKYGLLGGNFLEQYVVEIDFAARKVRLLDAERFAVPEKTDAPDETVLPIHIVGQRPVVPVVVNGHPLEVLLDTGAPGPVVLSGSAAEDGGVSAIPDVRLPGGMILGPLDESLGRIEKLGLGRFELMDVPAEIVAAGDYNWGVPSNSLIGYDVLAPFLVRIDYPRGRLWLKKRSDAQLTLFGVDWAASAEAGVVATLEEKGLLVEALLRDSPAGHRGVRPGDLIRWKGSEHDEESGSRALLADLAGGRKIVLIRKQDDGRGQDVVLEALGASARGPAPPVSPEPQP